MKRIEVRTQLDLDKALAELNGGVDADIHIVGGDELVIGGSATIGSVSGSATIGSVYGSATIRSVSGSATIRSVYGSATIRYVSSSATIGSVYGSATIGSVYDSATIGSVSGSATIRSVSGSATIGSVSGSATIGYVYDSATIRSVSGSATIRYVYDSATIGSVYGSATIRSVYDSATIGSVSDSATIRSVSDSATIHNHGAHTTITATETPVVWMHKKSDGVTGGRQIDAPKEVPANITDTLKRWGIEPDENGNVRLYKAVNNDLKSERGFAYPIGETVTCADWNSAAKCGGGLHFSPDPMLATHYYQNATRWLGVDVAVSDLALCSTKSGFHDKCKARSAFVSVEVDEHMRVINTDTESDTVIV